MQRQELTVQKADRRCLSCEATQRRHHSRQPEDCMTKHIEIQMDKKQNDTEVIHRSQRRNEDQVLLEGEPVRILGNTSTKGFGE